MIQTVFRIFCLCCNDMRIRCGEGSGEENEKKFRKEL